MRTSTFRKSKLLCSVFISCLIFLLSFSGCKKDFNEKKNAVTGTAKKNIRTTNQPNIILFVADDLGYEVPHFTGGQSYSTPNLDFMAANGIHFNEAFSHPDGFPSRLALYTGKYNFRNYIIWGVLPPGEKTIANMLEDAGYATCFAGKWQCDGGDARIHSAGFQNYLAYGPFYKDSQRKGRYKDPILYANGDYLSDSVTQGKYSEDMLSDYLCTFIDSNTTRPFFAVYSHNLVAQPYVPCPDDPAYPVWNTDSERLHTDTKYFAGMVNYMDKMIGKVINKVQADGLETNTIFMFIADNATQEGITSIYKGKHIKGTKTQTNKPGTLTPFVVYWKGTIASGQIDSTLIDYTDFLPTLADIAGISRLADYGILDGVSFYDNMIGSSDTNRDWVFCHWDNDINDGGLVPRERFVYNSKYKLYDTLNYSRFYNMQKDIWEKRPIPDNKLTPAEYTLKQQFILVLQSMHN